MQLDDGELTPIVDGRHLTDRELELAHKRRAALAPLMGARHCTASDIGRAAELLGCSPRTVWTLLKRYRLSLQLVDLVPRPNRRTTGKTFIEPKAEAIMAEVSRSQPAPSYSWNGQKPDKENPGS
jgi:molybdenum-dependent DNA-binding transcriptional regulator ModE